jgi:hypothetical protein
MARLSGRQKLYSVRLRKTKMENQKQQGPAPTVLIECDNCKLPFEGIAPLAEVINSRLISSVMLLHPEREVCPRCGTSYEFKLAGVSGYQYKYVPAQTPNPARIITPPSKLII